MKYLLTKLFISVLFTSCAYAADAQDFESFFSKLTDRSESSFQECIPSNREDFDKLSQNDITTFGSTKVSLSSDHREILEEYLLQLKPDVCVNNKITFRVSWEKSITLRVQLIDIALDNTINPHINLRIEKIRDTDEQ